MKEEEQRKAKEEKEAEKAKKNELKKVSMMNFFCNF